jgi:hypothetical protein
MIDKADLPTAEQCEQIFLAAVEQGDARGVDASLRILCIHDPHRAGELFETLRLGLKLADLAHELGLGR